MKILKQRPVLRMASFLAASLLCLLLGPRAPSPAIAPGAAQGSAGEGARAPIKIASVMAGKAVSNGLWKKPSVVLQASKTSITYPCPPTSNSNSGSCPSTADLQIELTAIAKDFGKQTLYSYTVTGGRVVGEGGKVYWDLSEAGPGVYTATVEVQDSKKHRALSSVVVKSANCPDCVPLCPCPMVRVTCYEEAKAGTLATCKVEVHPLSNLIAYVWSARDSSGEDLSGRINGRGAFVSIPTNGLAGRSVYITVELKGLDPSCGSTASSSIVVKP